MAVGRYSRVDNRKSSGYGSTITIVAFVALCLVGVWVMTSSSMVPVQKLDLSEDNKNEVTTQEAETNVESNIESNVTPVDNSDASTNENSNAAVENNSTAKDSENSNAAVENNTNVNVNAAAEDNGPRNEGNQKPFEDSQGVLPEDAIKADNKNPNQAVNNAMPEPQMEDKPHDNAVENKEDASKEVPENGEQMKVSNEPRVENKESEPMQTVENIVGDAEKKSEEVPVNTAEEKHEDRVQKKAKIYNLQGQADHSIDVGVEKQDNQVEKQDNQVENKKVENDKVAKESLGETDAGKQEVEQKVVDKKDGVDKSVKENSGKTDVMKQGQVDGEKRPLENSEKINAEKMETKNEQKPDQGSLEKKKDNPLTGGIISGAQSELLNEPTTQKGSFSTQATTSSNEKESRNPSTSTPENHNNSSWKLCKTSSGPDYIPCLDNLEAIHKLRTTKHYEHRERHCPENPPTCLVPVPEGYQRSIEWPTSREKIWYHNVPHTKLAEIKGHQNWVKVSGEYLTFPGGGTQFTHGALHYVDFIQQSVPEVAWGKRSRVVLDVGCGVASFGGFLFDRDVLTMSFAPKDEHEAQVQFALERGIPAISAVMGTKRLPYPGRVFDIVHCARCRVPWTIEGGMLLLELNRLLRPGGFFVWSATPIYQKLPEDVKIWEAMKKLTKAICWEVISITKDKVNGVGIAVYRKPHTNECYEQRPEKEPPLCPDSDDPNAAWNIPLRACIHKIPTDPSQRGSKWPEQWPARVGAAPYWLSSSEVGVYGKPAPEDFARDYEHWKRVVKNSYLNGLGIKWSSVRNAMDMRAIYGGFAAALKDLNIWIMNVVNIDAPDTLPIIYERGLFGIYHDWCESFSTYPRSYDLLHADHLFSKIKQKCNLMALLAEADRILRPEGIMIVRDNVELVGELENLFKSMEWDVHMSYSKNKQGMIVARKTMWRPKEEEILTYAIS